MSNSQNPALFGNVRVHGSNGASIGVQTDCGAMFIARCIRNRRAARERPLDHPWGGVIAFAVPEGGPGVLQRDRIQNYFHKVQLTDFLKAIKDDTKPLISLEDGRRTVELITGIYRSCRDGKPVKFPLKPENGTDYDGRLIKT